MIICQITLIRMQVKYNEVISDKKRNINVNENNYAKMASKQLGKRKSLLIDSLFFMCIDKTLSSSE